MLQPISCPECGETCDRDSYHNGFEEIYGPWGCRCGWSEDERYRSVNGCPSPAQAEYPNHRVDSRGGITPIPKKGCTDE